MKQELQVQYTNYKEMGNKVATLAQKTYPVGSNVTWYVWRNGREYKQTGEVVEILSSWSLEGLSFRVRNHVSGKLVDIGLWWLLEAEKK